MRRPFKMPLSFLLIHSPLVGPYTWIPVAEELERKGYHTIVPSLLPTLDASSQYVRAIASGVARAVEHSGLDDPLVIVGHSTAGSFLPAIRTALKNRVAVYIFVDARLPKDNTSLFEDSPADWMSDLRQMAQDGWLPPWSEWFGAEAMREVIPDGQVRARFVAELPRIPLAMFEVPIPVFPGWPDVPCGYICLSQVYLPVAGQARSMGWPVRELNAQHMHMLSDPSGLSQVLLDLVQKLK